MTHHEPTIASILRLLAGEYDGPVDEQQVLERVLERRPSSAKNPYATIRERLRWDGLSLGWLRLNRTQLMPLRIALQGLQFRCLPRPCDVEAGLLPLVHLQPFAGLRSFECLLQDHAGAPIAFLELEDERMHEAASPAFDLRSFYMRSGFRPGDSLLVQVVNTEPMVLQIEQERREDFRVAAVAAQDAELIEALVDRVRRASATLVPCDEIVLPIFAAAPWRGAYPGSPWQHLVLRDGRLQLVDDIFLTSQRFGALHLFSNDEVFEASLTPTHDFQAADRALLAEIETLQYDLRRARQLDAEAGLWSGQVQRASTTFGRLDDEADLGSRLLFGSLEEQESPVEWQLDETWLPDALLETDEIDPNDPQVIEAARARMFELLPPDLTNRLREARPEEAEVIIAGQLNMLLVRAPELFPRIDIIPPDQVGAAFAEVLSDDWSAGWEDEVDELDEELELEGSSDVLAGSNDLIRQFYDYLIEMGKSAATARSRASDLVVYADFLASYYGHTLAEGDYATLDECLFFYYPRRVINSSTRQVREICTSLKQFYAFLKQRGVVGDDRFAQAIWRRRDQAARVVAIYEQISSESPNFELLFEHLFLPYTE